MNNNMAEKGTIKDLLRELKAKDFFEKTNVLSFLCLCLFLLDCCVMGGGRYLNVFGMSIRMLLGVLCILFSLPTLLKKWKSHVQEPMNLLFALFIIWLIVCAVRGWIYGNNREVFMSDIKGFMYLFLVPISINCVTNKKRIDTILNVVLLGAFIQALIVFIINGLCSKDISFLHAMYYPVFEMGLGTVSVVSNSIFRIFMNSAPYLIVACVIVVFRQFQKEKKRLFYPLLTAFYLNAILLSYTRSLYGSAGITAITVLIFVMIMYPQQIKVGVRYILITAFCTVMLIVTEEFVFEASYLNFAVSRTFNTDIKFSYASTLRAKLREKNGVENDEVYEQLEIESQEAYLGRTEESDEFRKLTQRDLLKLVKANPIIGNGLGACSETRNGPDEYFYLDVLARMGGVGLILYMLPYICVIIRAMKNKKGVLAVCTMFPFWIATAFNPWMNAAIGIVWYAISVAIEKEMCLVNISELEQGV